MSTAVELAPAAARPSMLRLHGPTLLVLLALALMPAIGADDYLLGLVTRLMTLAIAAVSLDFLLGRAGLVSFGHAAFLGLGAYTTGILMAEGVTEVAAILPCVLSVAALFALLTGAVSLRTTGVYFIMITLAFGQMAFFAASSLAAYGGDDGLTLWNSVTFLGTGLLASRRGLFYATLAVLVLAIVGANAVVDSRFGRVLRAAKENPTRVMALGFDVYRFRLVAYVLAGTLAGVAGMLAALQAEFVSPALMSWQRSGELIVMVVLGGLATRNGALLGALAFVLLEVWLAELTIHWRLIFGPLLVLLVLFAKGGLSALLRPLTGEGRRG